MIIYCSNKTDEAIISSLIANFYACSYRVLLLYVRTFLVQSHDLCQDDLPLVEHLHDEGSDLGHGTDQVGLNLPLGQVQGGVEQVSK